MNDQGIDDFEIVSVLRGLVLPKLRYGVNIFHQGAQLLASGDRGASTSRGNE